jgi:hypothetical protein
MSSGEGLKVAVSDVQAVTPHNEALYEAGKKLLLDSVETGRDYCKFMITTSMSAIPVYLALLGLMLPAEYQPTWTSGPVLIVAPVVFLAAAGVAIAGYLPRVATFSLDLPQEIEDARQATIDRRRRFALAATVLFCVAALCTVAVALWSLSLAEG